MKTKNGSALLFATILLFVALSMVVSLTYVTVMEQKMSGRTKSSVGAFFNADSGVEWALNKIANVSGDPTLATAFSVDVNGKAACPDFGSGSPCSIYFLGENGEVLTSGNVSDIKAVRAVGTQGGETQRAIEAAVASGSNCEVVNNSDLSDGGDPRAKCPAGKVVSGGGPNARCTPSLPGGYGCGGYLHISGPISSTAPLPFLPQTFGAVYACDDIPMCTGDDCDAWISCSAQWSGAEYYVRSFAVCCDK